METVSGVVFDLQLSSTLFRLHQTADAAGGRTEYASEL